MNAWVGLCSDVFLRRLWFAVLYCMTQYAIFSEGRTAGGEDSVACGACNLNVEGSSAGFLRGQRSHVGALGWEAPSSGAPRACCLSHHAFGERRAAASLGRRLSCAWLALLISPLLPTSLAPPPSNSPSYIFSFQVLLLVLHTYSKSPTLFFLLSSLLLLSRVSAFLSFPRLLLLCSLL